MFEACALEHPFEAAHTDTLPSEIEAAIDMSCQLKGHLLNGAWND